MLYTYIITNCKLYSRANFFTKWSPHSEGDMHRLAQYLKKKSKFQERR